MSDTLPDELARAWADLPDALRAHPGVKRLHALAARQQAQVPDGWVLVPKEPDIGMLQAALEDSRYGGKRYGSSIDPVAALPHCYELAAARQIWAAMLAAAPKDAEPEPLILAANGGWNACRATMLAAARGDAQPAGVPVQGSGQ